MNRKFIASPKDCILVTGSNGFIGSKVVEKLLDCGFANLRCFVRPSMKLVHWKMPVRYDLTVMVLANSSRNKSSGSMATSIIRLTSFSARDTYLGPASEN